MRVVHLQKEDYDVLIARPSIWGNPYTHIKDRGTLAEFIVDTREEAIEKYREYLLNNEYLMSRIHELDGKILGCWCKPLSCHGDIIIEILTQLKFKKLFKK